MNIITRSVRCIAILFLFICLSISGFSQSTPDNKQAFVDQVVKQFALKDQLQEAPNDIQEQFEQNPLGLAPQENEELLGLLSEAYRIDLLLNDFKTALEQEITDSYVDEITQKLDEPKIQTVTDAQQEFYTLQGKRKRIITKYELEQQTPSPERISAIAALVDTTSAAGGSVESSIIILRSVIEAVGSVSKQHSFTDSQIDIVANNFRTQMQAGASQQTNDRLMVTYYNVDTDALENYVAFMELDAGQWLDQAISKSIQSAYKTASERLLQAVDTNQ